MDQYHLRRQDKALTDETEINRVLAKARYISLAMCLDQEPYLITLNHGHDPAQNCLYFHCAPKGKKIDILRTNPRVWGVAVEDLGYLDGKCDHAYRSVMFGGRVSFLESSDDKRHALHIMIEQQESNPQAVIKEQLTEKAIKSVTMARIDITEISGKEALP